MFGNQPYCIPSFIKICACTELWELLFENSYFWPKRHAIRDLPFVSDDFVSLTSDGAAIPVKILRDTGATQLLLLQDVLPLTEESFTGASVLVQGVELGVLKVPLHKVYFNSSLVSDLHCQSKR